MVFDDFDEKTRFFTIWGGVEKVVFFGSGLVRVLATFWGRPRLIRASPGGGCSRFSEYTKEGGGSGTGFWTLGVVFGFWVTF